MLFDLLSPITSTIIISNTKKGIKSVWPKYHDQIQYEHKTLLVIKSSIKSEPGETSSNIERQRPLDLVRSQERWQD